MAIRATLNFQVGLQPFELSQSATQGQVNAINIRDVSTLCLLIVD